ncbi:MAG: 16S rRNA (uracil(1498)-N(3))-methyltransferase, partial [Erythrobacter sp.]|nr:16S rRNA (uracil(1498)-N(3))-methyltransferase [Erythrobacter sp.]
MPDAHAPKTPAWPPRSAPRLFVADELSSDRMIAIEGNQAHYLSRVMRVGEGDTVILCDDVTGEWAARIASIDKRRIDAVAVERLRPREQVPDFWLCPALVK